MSVGLRRYNRANDYDLIDAFLIAHHRPGNMDGNWLEPEWEYMHFHPGLDGSSLGKIGVWEADGEIAAVTHYELRAGEAYFQFHPDYRHLREAMLDYAEANLTGVSKKYSQKYLCAYVNDFDAELRTLVESRGYKDDPEGARPLYRFDTLGPFPRITIPEGFRLTSLAEECDWAKVHRVMWKGFDHGDDVPMNHEELESRRRMFDTPKARRELKVAVVAPDGEFVSFCGMFCEPTHRYALVEPVATDPGYRRMGLGKAAVLEGIRRCGALGATVVYVRTDLRFYQAMGFTKAYNNECWVKYFD